MWYYKYQVVYWEDIKRYMATGHVCAHDYGEAASQLENYYGSIETINLYCTDSEGLVLEGSCTEMPKEI